MENNRKKHRNQNHKTTYTHKNGRHTSAKQNAICRHFGMCGGCQYLDIPYSEQLRKKQAYIDRLLSPYGKGEPIIGMAEPSHYRHKVNAVFHRNRNGEIISGVYEEGTHHVLPVTSCYIENEKADQIIETIRGLLKSFKITVYHEDSGYGILRHVMIRSGYASGEIMVVLVTAGAFFPSKQNFAKALRKVHPEITTIVQNINAKQTSMVLGDRDVVIYGKGYIMDSLCGKSFRLSPRSFYQVNPEQTEKLYQTAISYAGLTGRETILDAYCGIGTIGIVASDAARSVIAVELNPEAVKDARINVKLNQAKNVSVYQNDAGKFMVGLAAEGKQVDVVFMDPPRSGSDEAFLSSVLKLAPSRIVYISCGPETLARDLQYLTRSHAYRVEKFVPVDMFPFSQHCESVVLLSRVCNTK